MAIKAGLVGVNPKGVDKNGMPISSGGANVEAEIQQINLDIAQLQASKVGIGQLTANNKAFNFAYDSTTEKYGYKLDGTGDFIPFESAGGGPGWVKPAELTTEGLTDSQYLEIRSGGIYVDTDNGKVIIDIVVYKLGSTTISGLPAANIGNTTIYLSANYSATESDVIDNYISNATLGCIIDTQGSAITSSSATSVSNVNYIHAWGMYDLKED